MKKILALLVAFICLFACTGGLAEGADRIPAPYTYDLADDETLYVENLIFNGDVVVSGGMGMIMFANCEFNGNVVQASETGCRLFLLPDCTMNGRFVFSNSIQESNIDVSFPKILSYVPAEVIAVDCIGTFGSLGAFDVTFNGETYTLADCEVFYDENNPDQGMIPYEGQEANLFVIAQWWENGELNILTQCEYDPTL